MKKILTLLFTCILSLVCLCACDFQFGKDSTNSSDSENSSVSSQYSLNKNELKMNVGDIETLVLNGAESSNVQWETFNETIATVENGVVTALKEGAVNIAAVYGEEVFVCRVVIEEILETIPVLRIINAPLKVAVGDSTIVLETSFTNGINTIENVSFIWESDNPSVMTVDSTGKLSILVAGTATICVTCIYDGVTYTADCTIQAI